MNTQHGTGEDTKGAMKKRRGFYDARKQFVHDPDGRPHADDGAVEARQDLHGVDDARVHGGDHDGRHLRHPTFR